MGSSEVLPRLAAFLALALLLLLALVLAVGLGAVPIPPGQVLQSLWAGLWGGEADPIVWEIRLPRALMGALVGAALGVSGAAYQGLFRNPLADPYLMGAASGAAFGATVALALTQNLSPAHAHQVAQAFPLAVPIFAFLGGLLAVALALLLAGGATRTQDLILAGVVVGAVLTGLTTYLMLKDADRVRAVFSYTLGNLAFSGWEGVRLLGAYLLFSLPPLFLLARTLNALQLGEEVAKTLGFPLEALKLLLIATATLATASAISQAGIIGFVGLIVPHTLRHLVGGNHLYLLPASALGGAVLLVLADLLARTLTRPAELPVGVVTTLLGGPFFLWLLRRRRA